MAFINVGAYVDGERPKTKKALREALRDDPASVRFDSTSPYQETGPLSPASLLVTDVLVVVGPDPYTRRNWYASVTSDGHGKVFVK